MDQGDACTSSSGYLESSPNFPYAQSHRLYYSDSTDILLSRFFSEQGRRVWEKVTQQWWHQGLAASSPLVLFTFHPWGRWGQMKMRQTEHLYAAFHNSFLKSYLSLFIEWGFWSLLVSLLYEILVWILCKSLRKVRVMALLLCVGQIPFLLSLPSVFMVTCCRLSGTWRECTQLDSHSSSCWRPVTL